MSLKNQAETFEQEQAMMGAGLVDDEARELAKYWYSKLPEKERPPMSDYLKGLKDDPTKAPKSLRTFFEPAEKQQPKTETSEQQSQFRGGLLPRSTTGVEPKGASSATSDSLSPEKIREIRERAQRTGNWDEWKQIRNQIDSKR